MTAPGRQGFMARTGATLLTLALILGACGGDGGDPTSPVVPPPPEAPRVVLASPSFSTHILEIFERRGCATEGCHGSAAGSLTLGDAATSYANLVGVRSNCNGLLRVVPGDADNSVLVMKVEGTHLCGSRMPLGDEPLDSIDQQNIRNWVTENAINN